MTERITVFGLLLGYKLTTLLVGLLFSYMGYRLFLADKAAPAGDFTANAGGYAFNLKGGAPGVFFSLFGTILICFSIFQGVNYDHTEYAPDAASPVPQILPDQPPTANAG